MKTEVRACIKRAVIRLQHTAELTSVDATLIDSIAKLVEFEQMAGKE